MRNKRWGEKKPPMPVGMGGSSWWYSGNGIEPAGLRPALALAMHAVC
jgi:hypothetical protein